MPDSTWIFTHDGLQYSMTYMDAKELQELEMRVKLGMTEPKMYSFVPAKIEYTELAEVHVYVDGNVDLDLKPTDKYWPGE